MRAQTDTRCDGEEDEEEGVVKSMSGDRDFIRKDQ